MKKLFILVCIFAFVQIIQAQDAPLPKTNLFENKEFKLDSAYLPIPRHYFDGSTKEGYLPQNKEWVEESLKDPFGDIKSANPNMNLADENKMPIYKPPFLAEMPIYSPGSSIKYHLIIKNLSKKEFNKRWLE